MQIVKEYIGENKKKLLILVLLLVIAVTLSVVINKKNEMKVYSSSDYIYTKEEYAHDGNLYSSLPYINVKGSDISSVNSMLLKRYYEITSVDRSVMIYKYYKYDNILSLVVKVYNQEEFGIYPEEVYFYNVDIKKGRLLSDEELLEQFGIDNADVLNAISGGIRKYYDYELEKGYVDSSCNFICYLTNTESAPLEKANYYIDNGYLMAYKGMKFDSRLFYDRDSGLDLFKIKIKKLD